MKRELILSIILCVCIQVLCKYSFATNYTNTGTSTNYSLSSGDTLFVTSGTYTGSISNFSAGAVIIVADIAIFNPLSMPSGPPGPGSSGTIYLYGQATLNQNFRSNTSFTLHNYGIFTVTGTTIMSGSGQVWNNYYGAILNLNGTVTVNSGTDNNTINNHGTLNAGANITMTTNALLNNYFTFAITGTFTMSGGTLNNRGKMQSTGALNFNNGAAIIYNYCVMSSLGGISNTSNNFYNNSYLWAKNDLSLGNITNSGTIYNTSIYSPGPMIHAKNFTNSGTVTGRGVMYFYGTSSQSGGGTTGASGVTTDTLKIYDITNAGSNPYDAQSGTVYGNAIKNAWGIPDSTRAWVEGCSVEVITEIPLPVNWKYFYVSVTDVPVLNWSAEYDAGTVFEVQRSYDGNSFHKIKDAPAEEGQSTYNYTDRLVNKEAAVVFYRIKAIELNGKEKYSPTRKVKFSNKPGSPVYAFPNPFTSNFTVNYQAPESSTITIRVFNASGQQQFAKNIPVTDGANNINISEAAALTRGIYFIQVTKGSQLISSGKIVKQ